MLSRMWGATVVGVDGRLVSVEVNVSAGLPAWRIVGLPDGAVRESMDRIWAALRNSGYETPKGRVTVSLSPADLRKEGAGFDLPIATGLLAATGQWRADGLPATLLCGELALDGRVRAVRGVLPMALAARAAGRTSMVVPAANSDEASMADGLRVFAIQALTDLALHLDPRAGPLRPAGARLRPADGDRHTVDLSDVRGQLQARRALEVAAAGGHNLLYIGPPGAGKTMLARRLPTVLPPLSAREALEASQVHSAEGRGLVHTRPFRAPHHSASFAGLCGGGPVPRPGEVSLAHCGVLFLDELPEFRRDALEGLREPMESGAITIRRARYSVRFPAQFMLVASMNPCPCGYTGHPVRPCTCTEAAVRRYAGRISGPMVDRFDLHVSVPPGAPEAWSGPPGESSRAVAARVLQARTRQHLRYGDDGPTCNAALTGPSITRWCGATEPAMLLLREAVRTLGLSARAYVRVLKVARTLADLEGTATPESRHVAEAIQFRLLDRQAARA